MRENGRYGLIGEYTNDVPLFEPLAFLEDPEPWRMSSRHPDAPGEGWFRATLKGIPSKCSQGKSDIVDWVCFVYF